MPVGAGIATGLGGVAANLFGIGKADKDNKRALADVERFQTDVRTRADPYISAGRDALATISDPNRMMSEFYKDPGYDFQLKEGINALNTNKAAAGLLRSGSTLKDTIGFGTNLAN